MYLLLAKYSMAGFQMIRVLQTHTYLIQMCLGVAQKSFIHKIVLGTWEKGFFFLFLKNSDLFIYKNNFFFPRNRIPDKLLKHSVYFYLVCAKAFSSRRAGPGDYRVCLKVVGKTTPYVVFPMHIWPYLAFLQDTFINTMSAEEHLWHSCKISEVFI